MASFTGDTGVLHIPASSPYRRDYQLRSCSKTDTECDTSMPQSPWLPRTETFSDKENLFRLFEYTPVGINRSNFRSGPLPVATHGMRRSYNSGPLPYCHSPLPSYFGGPPSNFNTIERQLSDISSAGKPEVGSRFREDEEDAEMSAGEGEDDEVDGVRNVLDSSHLSKTVENCSPSTLSLGAMLGMPRPNDKSRNPVSEKMGVNYEKTGVCGGSKSGSLAEPNNCPNRINQRTGTRKHGADVEVGAVAGALKHQSSGSTIRETANNSKNESSNSGFSMVAIPFKWEDAPFSTRRNVAKKSHLRISSSSPALSGLSVSKAEDFQVNDSHNLNGRSEHLTENEASGRGDKLAVVPSRNPVATAAAKCLEAASSPSEVDGSEEVVCSAVPFKWEEAPGKPKLDERPSPEAAPALQLPPRLARLNIMRGNAPTSRSHSMSVVLANRSWTAGRTSSAPAPASSPSIKILRLLPKETQLPLQSSPGEVESSHTRPAAFRSCPLDKTGRPHNLPPMKKASGSLSEHISQFGSAQHLSGEFSCDSSNVCNTVRSPTSTLCGPSCDGNSNPSPRSDKSSRKSPVSGSFSSNSHSVESFEAWFCGDHSSPTSRHITIRETEVQGTPRYASVGGHDEGETGHGGALVRVRSRLNLSSSSSKPPLSPTCGRNVYIPRSVDSSDYSSHGEEFYDCHDINEFPRSPSKPEEEVDPPTRLPYKMPSPPREVSVEPELASPTSAFPEFSNCLAFPRLLSKTSESVSKAKSCIWVANPSSGLDAPSNSMEDGVRSPAYKATLELLSPLPNLSKKSGFRSSKLGSSSLRQRQPHLVVIFPSLHSRFSRLVVL